MKVHSLSNINKSKKLFSNDAARYSAIENIRNLVDLLGAIKSSELDYTSYREIVGYLSRYEELIKDEIQNK